MPARKIPNILFYNPKGTDIYRMISTQKSSLVGEMTVSKRNDLYIASLDIEKDFRRHGYGRMFIDFAKKLSQKMGLNGNLRVMAGLTTRDINNPSHIFYRKCGFTTKDPELLEQIDTCIKNKTQLEPLSTLPAIMYYTHKM